MTDATVSTLKKLFTVVAAEAASNPAFAERLGAVLKGQPTRRTSTRRRRRIPGVLDPFSVARSEGREGLEQALRRLDVDQLKDIVAEHGMDPARLALRWRRPERLVDHIVSFVATRERKGDAFRASVPAESGGNERS